MKRSYVIATDSDSELPVEYVKATGIPVFAMPFTIDGQEYQYDLYEGNPIPNFFERLAEGAEFSTSSRPSWELKDFFKEILEEGKDILYLAFSESMSNHFSNCLMAKEELQEEYPDAKIEMIDTKSISLGQALLVRMAYDLQQEGKPLGEVTQWVKDNVLHSVVFFVVDDLDYLKRGGRLSASGAFFGGLLDIKPIIIATDEGKLEPVEKVKGRRRALKRFIELIHERATDLENASIYIAYSDLSTGEELKAKIEEECSPKEVVLVPVGPVIGGHTGPNVLGMCFYGSHR